MNFTLEALDQVIEATGISYAEAKAALTEADGDAESAIAAIQAAAEARALEEAAEDIAKEAEEAVEEAVEAAEEAAEDIFEETSDAEDTDTNPLEDLKEKITGIIRSGQVRKVVIKRDGEEVLSVPLNLGLLGGIVGVAAAPTAVIVAAIAAYGLDCTIEIEKKDGSTENLE